MMYRVVDAKKNELVRFEVEMTKNMCTVAPVILDNKFNKYDNRFRTIRRKALKEYCELKDNERVMANIKLIEKEVCNEVDKCLTEIVKEFLGQGYKIYLINN